MEKIACVTGANRGIGFETCRQLAKQGFRVILTSRSEEKGQSAARNLSKEGLDVTFRPLDVTDGESVSRLRSLIMSEYHRLDVLVNNAGVHLDKGCSGLSVPIDVVSATLDINFLGPLRLCQAFLPIMKEQEYGRIVNVSSGMGALHDMGGGSLGYKASKTALNALTRVMAAEAGMGNIKVNSMCPGWVRTEMGGEHASRSTEQGADTIVWLAMIDEDGPTGGFFRDRTLMDW